MNIVPLHPPNPDAVDLLRDLLRQAEAGELQSLIYSAELAGGNIQNGHTDIRNAYETLGQLDRMKDLILRTLNEVVLSFWRNS